MEWQKLIEVIDRHFDVERCLEKVQSIYDTDHWFSYKHFQETADYCAETMKKMGLSQIEKLSVQADGKTKYGDWKGPRAWHAEHALLRFADGEVLADYRQMPCTLVMHSPATPKGGVEAEVVSVTDLSVMPEEGSLQGKILLVDTAAGQAVNYACKAGAVGIISDYIPMFVGVRETREDIYDDCRWESMSSAQAEKGIFAFKLTPRQGERLRTMLSEGPVWLFAEVETESYDGVDYTVSGAIPGTDTSLPEVFAYGHLYEPGANDNASGSAVLLQLMECFQQAIAKGILPRPKRTIRIAMGRECVGSMAYMSTHFPKRPMLCGAVADMIGAEKDDRAVNAIHHNPLSNWSFTDAAITAADRMYQEYRGQTHVCKHVDFDIATDNIIADPALGIPTFAMMAYPALSYHSSMDKPEWIEPGFLKRNAVIIGTYLYGLADAGEDTCRFLREEILRQTKEKLSGDMPERRRRLLLEASGRALFSLRRISDRVDVAMPVAEKEPVPEYAMEKGLRVPVRMVLGSLTLSGNQNLAMSKWKPAWNAALNIPLFWADGERTLWEIAVKSAVEMYECTEEQIQAKFLLLSEYFEYLVELGYVSWK